MYPDNIREIIKFQRNNGLSYLDIAKMLNMTKSSVQSLSKYKKKTTKQKRGRKVIINKFESMKIKRCISNSNSNGLKVNCNRILENLDLDVSRRTLNNWLIKKDYVYARKVQSIELSKEHRLKRIDVVSSWIHQNIDWSNAVFTDEKKFHWTVQIIGILMIILYY